MKKWTVIFTVDATAAAKAFMDAHIALAEQFKEMLHD